MDPIKSLMNLFTREDKETDKVQGDESTPQVDKASIVAKTKKWRESWTSFSEETGLLNNQKKSKDYWKGKQYQSQSGTPMQNNLIFESLETYLPMISSKSPDPIVACEDEQLKQNIQNALYFHNEYRIYMRALLKQTTRHWSLNLFAAVKTYWDPTIDDLMQKAISPDRIIFDKDAYVDPAGNYHGEYLGEKKKGKYSDLLKKFPDVQTDFKLEAARDPEKSVIYYEWWTTEKLFFTTEKHFLGEYPNPNWNEDTQEQTMDEFGNPSVSPKKGSNQLEKKMIPYTVLNIFSLGEHPVDETSLIIQNIPSQDGINKRLRQIDKNVDNMNNGLILSGDHFTKEQAAEASAARMAGKTLWVPKGDLNKAARWDSAQALPEQVFNNLQMKENTLRSMFGVQGSTATGIEKDQTVRGKMLRGQADTSRSSGNTSEFLERFVSTLYNWQVQMMRVYYTDERSQIFQGASEQQSFKVSTNLLDGKKINITVKDGSMVQKSPLEERNSAIELFQMGAISPKTLYGKLGIPNPEKALQEYVIHAMIQSGMLPPSAYLMDPQQAIQQGEQAMQAQQQAQSQQVQAESQASQQQAQIAQQEAQTNMQVAQHKAELDQNTAHSKMQIEQQKGQNDMQIAQQKNQVETNKAMVDLEIKKAQGQLQIDQQKMKGQLDLAQFAQKMKHSQEAHKSKVSKSKQDSSG
jgi:hypothetical protein